MTSHESPEPRSRAFAGLASFPPLAVAYLMISAAPFVVAHRAGLGWGVLAGIAFPLTWMLTMPPTCRSGGFLWSILGMQQFLLLCTWALRGIAPVAHAVF